jgi:hypothetical protein
LIEGFLGLFFIGDINFLQFRTYHDEEIKGKNQKFEVFGRPSPATTLEMRRGVYDKLDIDGFV